MVRRSDSYRLRPLDYRALVALAALLVAVDPRGAAGRQAAATPAAAPLRLEAVLVEPAAAAPDALVHLQARIRNGGRATASAFAFRVKLDQRELGVYRDHLFLDPVAPGETRTLELFSFWTEETGRPLPATGKIVVEVTLGAARWMKEERDADGTRVWSDLGAVEGLPQTATFTVEIKK